MKDILQKASETANFIASRINERPKIAIILGSGLGSLANEIYENRIEIPYVEIPNFPTSKVEGHGNKLIIGKIYDKDVIEIDNIKASVELSALVIILFGLIVRLENISALPI